MSAIQSKNGNIGTNFTPGAKTRVVFADYHKIFRQALVGLIKGQADIHVLGEASDGEEAVELARKFNPDVIVLDVSMPRMNGVEATRQIKTELPNVRVVILSTYQFRTKSATCSELFRPLIPDDVGHFFGAKRRCLFLHKILGLSQLSFLLPHRVSFQINFVSIVNEAVEDGIGQCRIIDDFMPMRYRFVLLPAHRPW